MNTMAWMVLFAVFIVVYLIIIEIFTIFFRLTGVTAEKARTQVISLLTNCGYTTGESEIIINSRRRRRLAQITMICGYSFSMVIVSVMVNVFLSLNQSEMKQLFPAIFQSLGVGAILILLLRLQAVRSRFDSLIEKIGNRIMFGKHSNVLLLIDLYQEKALVEVVAEHLPAILDGVRLTDSGLREWYGIQLLFVRHGSRTAEKIDGDTVVKKGDTLLLFGDYKTIRKLFEQPEEKAA